MGVGGVLGYEKFNIERVIQKIKPDVIAIGYDSHITGVEQAVRKYVEENKLKIKIVKIGKFGNGKLDSSSKVKQKIKDSGDKHLPNP